MSDKPRGLRKRSDPVVIPDFLTSQEFLDAFDEFLQLRKRKKGGKDSDYAIGLCIDDIVSISAQGLKKEDHEKELHHDKAVELVQYAIYRKWTAIFPKKEDDWTPPGKQKTVMPDKVFIPLRRPQKSEPIKIQEAMAEEQIHKVEQTMFEHLETVVKQSNKLPGVWNFDAVFNHMKRTQLITDTKEEMQQFKARQIEWLLAEEKACKLKNDVAGEGLYKSIRNNEESLKAYCRKKRVHDHFQKKYNLLPF